MCHHIIQVFMYHHPYMNYPNSKNKHGRRYKILQVHDCQKKIAIIVKFVYNRKCTSNIDMNTVKSLNNNVSLFLGNRLHINICTVHNIYWWQIVKFNMLKMWERDWQICPWQEMCNLNMYVHKQMIVRLTDRLLDLLLP